MDQRASALQKKNYIQLIRETTSDVQMETAQPVEDENDNAVSTGEGADEPPAQTIAVNMAKYWLNAARILPPKC